MVPLVIRGSSATVKQYSMLRLIFFAGIISGWDLSIDSISSLRIGLRLNLNNLDILA